MELINTIFSVGKFEEKDFYDITKPIEIELDLKEDITIDIVEIKLLDAARKLDELIGVESTLEDVYDTIFKNFCIGK